MTQIRSESGIWRFHNLGWRISSGSKCNCVIWDHRGKITDFDRVQNKLNTKRSTIVTITCRQENINCSWHFSCLWLWSAQLTPRIFLFLYSEKLIMPWGVGGGVGRECKRSWFVTKTKLINECRRKITKTKAGRSRQIYLLLIFLYSVVHHLIIT